MINIKRKPFSIKDLACHPLAKLFKRMPSIPSRCATEELSTPFPSAALSAGGTE